VKHPLGFEFEVLDADPRRVKRLRVRGLSRKPSESPPAEHG
jgi:magnesium and cobalt transporter